MKRVFLLLISLLHFSAFFAATLSDETKINLLTCTAGDAIYTKFGHTAIHVSDPQNDIDLVFNYGAFSFYADNFYYKFVKGETDYQLGINIMENFRQEYDRTHRQIFTQELNLSQAEKQAIFDALIKNYKPENRIYRYNFVFDNCATRPYYLIEKTLQKEILAPQFDTRQDTYRDIITRYTGADSWLQFGIDLIFGENADCIMTPHERLFLPEELMNRFSEGQFAGEQGVQKIIKSESVGVFADAARGSFVKSPYLIIVALVLLNLLAMFFEICLRRRNYIVEIVLSFVLGVLGIVGTYLSFFSEHPLVQDNYNLLFMNPFFLVIFVLLLFPQGRRIYQKIELPLLAYFMLALLIWLFSPQDKHLFIGISASVFILKLKLHILLLSKKKRSARQRRLFFLCVVAMFSSMHTVAQERPKLLVQVLVDGLRYDNIELLENYFPTGGLRTLLAESAYIPHMEFPHRNYGGPENTAMICTGTLPFYHGISEAYFFNRTTLTVQKTLEDKQQLGVATDEQLSPRNLLAGTVSDELKMTYNDRCKVYSVAIDANDALIMAGHNGDGAVWINEEQLQWASTTYYNNGFSVCADEMNVSGCFKTLALREWVSQYSPGSYLFATEAEKVRNGFSYNSTLNPNSVTYPTLSELPWANTLVVELALKIQEEQQLGYDNVPDILTIQLTTKTPLSAGDKLRSAEQEDMYVKLNQDLGFLFEQLSKRVGKENMLVLVAGKPKQSTSVERLTQNRIPSGIFNLERAVALTNTYLMAKHGYSRWIDGYYNNQIYLNHKLIEDMNMSLPALQKQIADFLLEFEGVQAAFTLSEIQNISGNDDAHLDILRNSLHKKNSGDVIFTLQPGWLVADRNEKLVEQISELNATAPVFFWGMNIAPQKISQNCSAIQIAPTLSNYLHIPLPNACLETSGILIKEK